MYVHHFRRDAHAARRSHKAVREAAAAAGVIGLFEALIRVTEGWREVHLGEVDRGIERIRSARQLADTVGHKLIGTWCVYVLSDCLLMGGYHHEGLELIRNARETKVTTDDFLYEPELHRIEGEFLLGSKEPRPKEAEEAFRWSIDMSKGHETKVYELRATTSLAQLLRDTGRSVEARDMLSEIYGWFTEGFDTLDLIEAKQVLDELGGSP